MVIRSRVDPALVALATDAQEVLYRLARLDPDSPAYARAAEEFAQAERRLRGAALGEHWPDLDPAGQGRRGRMHRA